MFIVIKEHVSQCHDAAHMFLWKFIAHRIMNILIHINNVGKKSRFVFCFLTNTLTTDFKYPIYVNVRVKLFTILPFLHLNHPYPASQS